MIEALIGLSILFTVVFTQVALRRRRNARIQRHWSEGEAAFKSGEHERASAAFEGCLKLAPLLVSARVMLARSRAALGDWETAERHLRLAADLEPRRPEWRVELGLFYLNAGDGRDEDAIAALRKAMDLDPELRGQFAAAPAFAELRRHPGFRALIEGGGPGAEA